MDSNIAERQFAVAAAKAQDTRLRALLHAEGLFEVNGPMLHRLYVAILEASAARGDGLTQFLSDKVDSLRRMPGRCRSIPSPAARYVNPVGAEPTQNSNLGTAPNQTTGVL